MSGSFGGLSTALSALYAQRRAIEVTGHNVANANTDGYSRQRLDLQSTAGPVAPAMFARWTGAGQGVTVAGISRSRDEFLEQRALSEHGEQSRLTTLQTVYGHVEDLFGEPGEAGIQAQLAQFWAGWDDLANSPQSAATRAQLLERGRMVGGALVQTANALAGLWRGSTDEARALVEEINVTAASVATLNEAIKNAVESGLAPNDLLDQRDTLVLRLGELAGASARAGESGTVDVFVGGSALVWGVHAERLATTAPPDLDVAPAAVDGSRPPAMVVRWAKDGADGYPVPVASGELGGLLAAVNTVLPDLRDRLDTVAVALRERVNAQHRLGRDSTGAIGGDFFTGSSARTLAVALTDPARVAAAAQPPGAAGASLDGDNAAALAELANARGAGAPDETYRALVVDLGVQAQGVSRRVDMQRTVTEQVDLSRTSASGVNIDEEMANLVAYQRGYEGAARVLTAIDDMLDTLINRTGLVGR